MPGTPARRRRAAASVFSWEISRVGRTPMVSLVTPLGE